MNKDLKGLKQHEGEYVMKEISFLGDLGYTSITVSWVLDKSNSITFHCSHPRYILSHFISWFINIILHDEVMESLNLMITIISTLLYHWFWHSLSSDEFKDPEALMTACSHMGYRNDLKGISTLNPLLKSLRIQTMCGFKKLWQKKSKF